MHNFGSFIKFFIFLSLIIPTSTLPSSLNVKNIQSVIFSPSLRKLLQDQSYGSNQLFNFSPILFQEYHWFL
ncbi:hypothetical protein HanXRQr2_Chr13g0584181 [Helianthus annuus]|uniref:Uncharacterized protein n=1 Tax=Helianthus annuus TaxID=4232 RepID=A0A9K3HBB2_HELAN|nr:hypothetical protein HanXRQr2_Chr13g0584181 [Helianthus annuus]